jgi:hypothetical protein
MGIMLKLILQNWIDCREIYLSFSGYGQVTIPCKHGHDISVSIKLKCLETTLINQICIHKGTMKKFDLGNVCYYLPQSLLSSPLPIGNTNTKIT